MKNIVNFGAPGSGKGTQSDKMIAKYGFEHISTGDVLMLAYMNEDAWNKTLESGEAYYYSRSRKSLWHKGETSGHTQKVKEIFLDCDKDAILLKIEQHGVACHTGKRSCFFNKVM